MANVMLACLAFVGTHFLLSHLLRAPLVRAAGERGFLALYSLVAFVTLGWIVIAYRAAPAQPLLWEPGDAIWAAGSVLTLFAAVLLMGSLIRNPALPDPIGATRAVPEAKGVFAITRHPMMWGFALWGLAHILVFPGPSNIAVAGSIMLLALVGAHLQDRKKAALQPDFWPEWERRTSYWPFAAIAQRRARFSGFGAHALAGGFLVWMIATWAHYPLSGWAAGVWYWID